VPLGDAPDVGGVAGQVQGQRRIQGVEGRPEVGEGVGVVGGGQPLGPAGIEVAYPREPERRAVEAGRVLVRDRPGADEDAVHTPTQAPVLKKPHRWLRTTDFSRSIP